MQDQKPDIESLVEQEPQLEEVNTDYRIKLSDPEAVKKELGDTYSKFQQTESKGLLHKVKQTVMAYIGEETEKPYSQQRQEQVKKIAKLAQECKSALIKGGKAKKKVQDLEEKITAGLLADKNNFLQLNDYVTKLQDAINYTETQLEDENSLDNESILRSQLAQLREKEENTYQRLDRVSVKITQTAAQRKQAKEYVRYAESQSYKIEQTLQSAQHTIQFLEATEGMSEYLRAGSLAAELHQIFDDNVKVSTESDELMVDALNAFGDLESSEMNSASLSEANDFNTERMRKEMAEHIEEARKTLEGY